MICPTGKVENIFGWDWTGQIRLNGFTKFDFTRIRRSRMSEMPDGTFKDKPSVSRSLSSGARIGATRDSSQ
jgi:hypothetical protein